jgi:poly(A) polymerase
MRELNLEPGRIIGQLLEAIREGQATGKIESRDQALGYAREQLKDIQNP